MTTFSLTRKDAKVERMGSMPLFEESSKRELAEIASLADEVDLPAERELTREGRVGKEFMVLVEGSADVIRDGRVINTLGPGDFLGEIALVTGAPRTATVRTKTPSRLLVMNGPAFRRVLNVVPSLQAKVLQALDARLPKD